MAPRSNRSARPGSGGFVYGARWLPAKAQTKRKFEPPTKKQFAMNGDHQQSQTGVAPLDGPAQETAVPLRRKERAGLGHARRRRTAFRSVTQLRKRHSMRQPASGAGPAWRLAKTRLRLCSRQLRSCTWLYFPKGKSRRANVLSEWRHRWIRRDSGIAAIRKHARWNARRRYRYCTSLA